jgi:transposase InsO family protein
MASAPLTGYGPRARLIFNGDIATYNIWETRFINYLYTVDEKLVKAIEPRADGVTDDKDFDKKNRRAYAELTQVLDERSLELIMTDCKNNGREALKVLRQHYVSTEKPRILALYEELTTLTMTDTENITDYLLRAERASTGLKTAGETISDNLIMAMVLKGLPATYQPFVVVHTQLDKYKTMTEFKAALHNYANTEDMRTTTQTAMTARSTLTNPTTTHKLRHTPTHGHTTNTTSTSRNKSSTSNKQHPHSTNPTQCLCCGNHNHKAKDCRTKHKLTCTYCKRPGHIEKVCLTKKKAENTDSYNTITVDYQPDPDTHFAFTTNTIHADKVKCENFPTTQHKLLVDCGATCHIINDRDRFTSYNTNFDPKHHYIQLADGRRSNQLATAKGDAIYTVLDSDGLPHTITLKDALLAPDFPTSLFSVTAATDSGATVTFQRDAATLTIQHTTFNINKHGRLFYLHTVNNHPTYTTKTLHDWHTALGHVNYDDIKKLATVTTGMTITQAKMNDPCMTCETNKFTRQPKTHDTPTITATKPLERVHTDLCGPITPTSRDGHKYVINFIDEYSSMIFVYCLRSKDEAHIGLQKFLADVSPIGQPLELHSDNGGEYLSSHFQNILLDRGIKHTTTTPHSPYQNGKAERSWRSIMEMARCLLTESDLPKQYWSYSVRHTQYLRNRTYQRRTDSTAYELFTNRQPDMRTIHTFGSPCTFYNEGPKAKMDKRGLDGTYLGVNPQNNGYYILNHQRNNVITTRNVHIHRLTRTDDNKVDLHTPTTDHTDNLDATLEPGANQDTETADSPLRPQRDRRPPSYLSDYATLTKTDYAYLTIPFIPNTYEEAIQSDEADQWKMAMDKEIESLRANQTWTVKPLPADRTETKGRWVYTIKQGKTTDDIQYKARYVAKGFTQIPGLDFDCTHSPTTRLTSIRTLLQKAVNDKLLLHQLDVKGAYLNANIDKDIYVQQPPGYEETNNDTNIHMTCHLNKSLYGLRQSGRNWHETLTTYLQSLDYTPNKTDPCIYTKCTGEDQTIILFWVDDIILASNKPHLIQKTKEELSNRFKMDDRGELRWFLGIDFIRDGENYIMSQERYADILLRRFNMHHCNPVSTPAEKDLRLTKAIDAENEEVKDYPYRKAVGALIYLMMGTRPDISWTVSKLSQYLDKPGRQHINALKHLFRYIRGTKSYGIVYSPTDGCLTGYTDSDWAGDTEDRRSTTGYIITLGGAPISWKTRKQPTVALSSCEAEYMAMTEGTKEMLYLRDLCTDLGLEGNTKLTIYVDNQGAIALTMGNTGQHNRTKHIDVRYHFIREQKDITYKYIPSTENPADVLTKPLGKQMLKNSVQIISLRGRDEKQA